MASKEAAINPVSNSGRVPVEILRMIFNLLTLSQKRKARLVCNLWRRILDTPELGGITFGATITNDSVLTLLRSCRQMDRVVIRGVTKRLPRMSSLNNRYPQIKKAIFAWKNSEATIKSFLTLGTGTMESLKVSNFSLERVRPKVIGDLVQTMDWSRLRKLKLSLSIGRRRSEKHVNATLALMAFAKFPNLKVLELDLSRFYHCPLRQPILLAKIRVQFYSFLVAHSDSLTVLNCCLTVFASRRELVLETPAVSTKLKQVLSKLKIQECLMETRGHAGALQSIVLPCLMTGTLKRFKLFGKLRGFGRFRNWPGPNGFPEIFEVNRNALEEIEIRYNYEYLMDLSIVPRCTALKSLKIREPFIRNFVDASQFSRVFPSTLYTLLIPAGGLPMIHSANRGKIEHLTDLTLCDGKGTEGLEETLNSLTEFVSLKSLHLTDLSLSAVELLAMKDALFPNLVELRIDKWDWDPLEHPNEQFDPNLQVPNCVLKVMPAIEVLKIGQVLGLEHFQMLLNLEKLRQLDFCRPTPELSEYCDRQPGLKLSPIRPEIKRRPNRLHSFRWRITVRNRTILKFNSGNSK